MQNKRSLPRDIEIPELSPAELAMVEYYGQGTTQAEAYRKAYSANGYSKASLEVRACQKFSEPKIQQYLATLRLASFHRNLISREQRIAEELAFAQRCEDAGNFGAAASTYDRVNKLQGLYVDKVEITQADPLDTLEQIKKLDPVLASYLANGDAVPKPN